MAWTPLELPYQRDKAARILLEAAEVWRNADSVPEEERQATAEGLSQLASDFHLAELTWIDRDVCSMLEDVPATLPDWSPAACMPGDHGMLAFDHSPAEGVWANGVDGQWRTVQIDAVLWSRHPNNKVTIRALSRFDGHREFASPLRKGIPFDEVVSVTLDIYGVHDGEVQVRRKDGYSGPTATGKQLVSLVGAAWLLLSQPTVVSDGPAHVATVKRSRPGQKKQRQQVRVSVKRLTSPAPAESNQAGRGKRTFSHRWWVRGHWRQQPYGPRRELRKPIFIAPHTAGAAEGEVDDRPQVQILKD